MASRTVANMLIVEHGAAPDKGIALGYIGAWYDDMEWEAIPNGMGNLSHEGGEYQEIYEHFLDLHQCVRQSFSTTSAQYNHSSSTKYQCTDVCTYRDCLRALRWNWDDQMPQLVRAYLD